MSDLDAIEGISMDQGEMGHGKGMAHSDRQMLEALLLKDLLEIVRCRQLAELLFDLIVISQTAAALTKTGLRGSAMRSRAAP